MAAREAARKAAEQCHQGIPSLHSLEYHVGLLFYILTKVLRIPTPHPHIP